MGYSTVQIFLEAEELDYSLHRVLELLDGIARPANPHRQLHSLFN